MTVVDAAIQQSLIDNCCSWFPYFMQEGEILAGEGRYPKAIQNISQKTTFDKDGYMTDVIEFYLYDIFDNSDYNILHEIQPKYEALTLLAYKLYLDVKKSVYEAEISEITRDKDQTVDGEIGVSFSITVKQLIC